MKKFTQSELEVIINNLNKGVKYCGIYHQCGVGVIFTSSNNDYIRFRRYGESSIKNTADNLQWLVDHIFKDCDTIVPAKWSDYHNNYIPVENKYMGINCNFSFSNYLRM